MEKNIKQVATRIKALREIEGESVGSLAKAFKISEQEYERYESGKADIPISFLYEFASRFNVELTALLTGEEPHMQAYSLVRKGKGPKVNRSKEYKYQDLAYNFKRKKLEVFEVTVDPKKGNKPSHFNTHPGQEFNYCLKGKIKIFIGKNEMILNPGDSLYFDSGTEHAMAALGNKPAKFIAVIS